MSETSTTSKYTKASVQQTAVLVLPKSALEVPLRSEMFGLVLNTRRITKAPIKAPTWICFVGANMGLRREVKGGAREYFLAQGRNVQIFGGKSEGAIPPICPFWYTTALFRPVKGTAKSA